MAPSSPWTAKHIAAISEQSIATAPLIVREDIKAVADNLDIWDAWPVQCRDGHPAQFPGTGADSIELWMALAAAVFPDPNDRHAHARIHLFTREGDRWQHIGPAMPDGFSPGSREWSGSAIFDPNDALLTLYFTAAGHRGEGTITFEQRMFSAQATVTADMYCIDWCNLVEIVPYDPAYYMTTAGGTGAIGTIKAFRDPAYFRDPTDGRHWLFFAASKAVSDSAFNGVIGAAVAPADAPYDWTLLPPLIDADGVNNELERPHVVYHGGRYYLFWSTQRHVFSDAGPTGPTGLYGMVSQAIEGPWEPLNTTGLVFANPPLAPAQAYSWFVLPDLSVTSFIDAWGADTAGATERRFGGTFAPFLTLRLDAMSAALEE